MAVRHSHATDESSLRNKSRDPSNSATRVYSLTAFSIPLRPRPHHSRENLSRHLEAVLVLAGDPSGAASRNEGRASRRRETFMALPRPLACILLSGERFSHRAHLDFNDP
jgi:hypothetical protein